MSTKFRFFDAHTHIQFQAFSADYKEVIGRAVMAGVGMVNVGTQKDTSRRALEIAHEYENESVFAAVGLHPIHTSKSFHDVQELGGGEAAKGFTSRGEEFDYEHYKKLALDPKVVAIGECGLDYHHVAGNKEHITKQIEAFEEQIKLANEVKKPLMIHCRSGAPERASPNGAGRDAFGDLIDILNSKSSILNSPPGITHFFTGTKDDAKKLLDMGFYFTFGGVITFPPRRAETSRGEAGARDYDEIIRMIPLDKILSETDAPYVAPVPHRGKRNEPAYVVEVVKKLAELRGVTVEKMTEQIFANAKRIFGI